MKELAQLNLNGLTMAPPQVLRSVRLVPLIRDQVRSDLRLFRRAYSADYTFVEVDRRKTYSAYVPHGLVANWTTDGSAVYGSQIQESSQSKDREPFVGFFTAQGLRKLANREGKHQLRFLPQHVAMEGLLALHFGGPSIAWTEYSKSVRRSGLSPRTEWSIPGQMIFGLEDALRLFEIHKNQTGVLVFVGDELASAFVVSHPEDYLALHHTLLTDFYGELLWRYGLFAGEVEWQPDPIRFDQVDSVEDLRKEVDELRSRWEAVNQLMHPALFARQVESERVYRFKPYSLTRFITDLDPKQENFIGERIVDDEGQLQYLKTYRLSGSQTRRAYLLKQLAAAAWDLEQCADSLGCRKSELILRLENVGFGYLLQQHVIDGARAQEKRR